MPINDPKTPFHEEESDEEMAQAAEQEAAEIDPALALHLREAIDNKSANAIVTSGVTRSQPS